ncbi:uncharacterized protein F4807DRAFT_461964 [Annulohypoxylon truncatum]|uniref:uncharacterized protein n=1 Tax=Annulohypoxylon truncatum TaxID=327061 RepID=UPI002007432B|nr:uncharacterized protein F4807DRAFT_461964 [Annulohypoxylon truncatum]KAI1208240.1 hypothetical protein F4807DRAFT_461964 [Annulohypoxylon truncatum]
MASPAEPRKPSPEERDNYYFGLAGTPKLIARTSCNPWVKQTRVEEGWNQSIHVPIRKEYDTVDIESDIVAKWSPELVEQLICSLRGCEWSFFFPIRIGLERTIRDSSDFPTILLIAVEDGTLSWDEGINIALGCREVLRLHNIGDVEVEIREGRCHNLAASVELEGLVNPARGFDEFNKTLLPLLSFPGYPVTYSENRRGQGTMGLHIKLQGDDSVYGLTCRHVVHRDRPAKESYKFSPESEPEYHAQATTETIQDVQYCLGKEIKRMSSYISELATEKQRWEDWYHLDESKSHLRPTEKELQALDWLNDEVAYVKKFIDPLERIEDKDARKIGQLMFHSPLEFSAHQKGYLKDWALIKLDECKFPESPKNAVFVGAASLDGSNHDADSEFRAWLRFSKKDENGFLSLRKSYVSLRKKMIVCKRGATTGLTLGKKNAVEAVIRKPAGLEGDQYAWQMIIIPLHGRFSAAGDSGSCVFDSQGRIVGLLSSSDDKGDWLRDGRRRYPGENISPRRVDKDDGRLEPIPDGMDITFVDPIQWVFDDIERFTSRKVELA